MCRSRENNEVGTDDLISTTVTCSDDINKKRLVELWGNSLEKLTPRQRHFVAEILSHRESRLIVQDSPILSR